MSEKSVAERLQLKGTRRLAVLNADEGLDHAIGAMDKRAAQAEARIVVLALTDQADFNARVPAVMAAINPDSILWLAYPKLTSARAGDLNRDIIHARSPALGLTTVGQIAIDATWSAMRMKRIGA